MTIGPFHDGFSARELAAQDYEPVASSFYGMRAFLIDTGQRRSPSLRTPDPAPGHIPPNGGIVAWERRGSLRSIWRQQYIWGPGVNEAQCLQTVPMAPVALPLNGTPPMPEHAPVWINCDCGFWAFTSGKHIVQVKGPAAFGVIQAWGRMVLGEHGFRAQKARLVALCFDTYGLNEIEDDDEQPNVSLLGAAVSRLFMSVAAVFGVPPAILDPKIATNPQIALPVSDDLAAAVTATYGVPVYDTTADMLRAHPLSNLNGLLPEETQ